MLQKSFLYASLVLKKSFLVVSQFGAAWYFCENWYFFFFDCLINRKLEKTWNSDAHFLCWFREKPNQVKDNNNNTKSYTSKITLFVLFNVESSRNQPRPSNPAGTSVAAGTRSKQQRQFLVFWGTSLSITSTTLLYDIYVCSEISL